MERQRLSEAGAKRIPQYRYLVKACRNRTAICPKGKEALCGMKASDEKLGRSIGTEEI